MKPLKAPLCDHLRVAVALTLTATLAISWGFAPHRALQAKAWSLLPAWMHEAWGRNPRPLIEGATSADSRKHTDSLEAARHFLDVDDLPIDVTVLKGTTWSDASILLTQDSGWLSPSRFGTLPWELERTYWRLVRAWAPADSSPPVPEMVMRAAADLGHYLADAHVPLHTSGNYDGQRTDQRGIHALWETHAVEWMLGNSVPRHCEPCELEAIAFDPIWTPWEILAESHALAPEVFRAERTWQALCRDRSFGFRRRGRTMQLLPTPEALVLWDSLTHHHTWPRYCLAAQRIAAAWHAAWVDAGQPVLPTSTELSWIDKAKSYLPPWSAAATRTREAPLLEDHEDLDP